jgi:hypothetical protein
MITFIIALSTAEKEKDTLKLNARVKFLPILIVNITG